MPLDRVACPTCGEVHDLSDMQVGFEKPDAYFAVPPDERDRRVALTPNVAEVDGAHHFVRGVLEIPVRGEAQPFGWGVWVKVSRDDFLRHAEDDRDDGGDGWRARHSPHPGRIATQVPGYPQTLGVPVTVRPSSGGVRPTFDVADQAHPLAREQRDGIRVEDVLEHLSRYLHPQEAAPRGRVHVATVAADGWQLDDALARFLARDGVYWLPEAAQRESIRPGDVAKLIFAIEASDVAGAPEVHRERMWVEVDHVDGEEAEARYAGLLANDPQAPGATRAGMRVWFQPRHVIDVARGGGGAPASESPDVLRCARHGPSQRTFVCQHVARGRGLGFNQAAAPDDPRPDAWCDACDALLLKEGEWTDRAQAQAGITLICAACYDDAEARNRKR